MPNYLVIIMDKENIQLLILTVFGISGFFLFVILLAFFQLGHDDEAGNPGKGITDNESVRKKKLCSLTAETETATAIVAPRISREISLAQLKAATGNFCDLNLVKAGHSGEIFTGKLDGRELVVVKKVQPSKLEKDFYEAEMDVYGRVLNQSFLVPLLGHCVEGDEKLLVYKFMPNGDLATALAISRSSKGSDDEARARVLPWITRLKIATGVAEALVHLHHVCRPRLVHRDVKASSIFLTESFDIKLGSLSEAQRLDDGAMPVYDVYCFGKLLLDLVSGLNVSGCTDPCAESWMLKALPLLSLEDKDLFMELTDPSMILDEDLAKEVMGVAFLAKACLDPEILQNLSMNTVLELLQSPLCICIGK